MFNSLHRKIITLLAENTELSITFVDNALFEIDMKKTNQEISKNLDDYEKIIELGSGFEGTVYKVRNKNNSEEFALNNVLVGTLPNGSINEVFLMDFGLAKIIEER